MKIRVNYIFADTKNRYTFLTKIDYVTTWLQILCRGDKYHTVSANQLHKKHVDKKECILSVQTRSLLLCCGCNLTNRIYTPFRNFISKIEDWYPINIFHN